MLWAARPGLYFAARPTAHGLHRPPLVAALLYNGGELVGVEIGGTLDVARRRSRGSAILGRVSCTRSFSHLVAPTPRYSIANAPPQVSLFSVRKGASTSLLVCTQARARKSSPTTPRAQVPAVRSLQASLRTQASARKSSPTIPLPRAIPRSQVPAVRSLRASLRTQAPAPKSSPTIPRAQVLTRFGNHPGKSEQRWGRLSQTTLCAQTAPVIFKIRACLCRSASPAVQDAEPQARSPC
ncbi:hypothetical protein C8R44DRAFT_869294 [Mycena epipterygia]|nr:hypothetical protein C8R44DRAFT_869294 [Mycena epipterygia]